MKPAVMPAYSGFALMHPQTQGNVGATLCRTTASGFPLLLFSFPSSRWHVCRWKCKVHVTYKII
jgi:hypothetical protein